MFDIPSHIQSHCIEREKQIAAAGLHISDVLKEAKVDRSSWTGWKKRGIRPRLDKWMMVEAAIDRALAEAEGDAA